MRLPVGASPPRGQPPPPLRSASARLFCVHFLRRQLARRQKQRPWQGTACKVPSSPPVQPARAAGIAVTPRRSSAASSAHQAAPSAWPTHPGHALPLATLRDWRTGLKEGWPRTPTQSRAGMQPFPGGPKNTAAPETLTWSQGSSLDLGLCLFCSHLARFLNWVLLSKLTETLLPYPRRVFMGFRLSPFHRRIPRHTGQK